MPTVAVPNVLRGLGRRPTGHLVFGTLGSSLSSGEGESPDAWATSPVSANGSPRDTGASLACAQPVAAAQSAYARGSWPLLYNDRLLSSLKRCSAPHPASTVVGVPFGSGMSTPPGPGGGGLLATTFCQICISALPTREAALPSTSTTPCRHAKLQRASGPLITSCASCGTTWFMCPIDQDGLDDRTEEIWRPQACQSSRCLAHSFFSYASRNSIGDLFFRGVLPFGELEAICAGGKPVDSGIPPVSVAVQLVCATAPTRGPHREHEASAPPH
mmetsp:Transcript_71082/g.197452  ORF Transcript_71082/g.197452 Transcript_71082/m.197452 type:complete len:273 (-) Transcript_71082:34-852(-)